MNIKDLIAEGTQTLSAQYSEREAREMVFAYLEHSIGTSRHTHIIEPYYKVGEDDVRKIREAFLRMKDGEPLQYVMKKAYFYGREFTVCPDVLIPRPETEILCRDVIQACRGIEAPRILDLCTGSGCIAWTLALEIPGAEVVGVDISDGALAVARTQDFNDEMSKTGAASPLFIKEDVLAYPSPTALSGTFDVIVSNPPYVRESEKALMRTNVLDHEPHLALFVPDEDPLLFYRAVARWAMLLLKPGGIGMVEINEALAADTEKVFECFTDVKTIRDLNDRDRFVVFMKK